MVRKVVFVVYVAVLGFVLLNPRVSVPNDSVGWGNDLAGSLGAPQWLLEQHRFEFVVNVLVFVPLAVLGRWAWPGRAAWQWAVVGAAASVAVEVVQGLALPERSATLVDVVANTTGAVLGGLVAALLSRRRTAGGTRPTSPGARGRLPGPRS